MSDTIPTPLQYQRGFGYNSRRFAYVRRSPTAELCGVQKTKTMNIVITGSLGHIGKPLTEELVYKGHHVKVISSKPEKQADIQAVGATDIVA